MARIHTPDSLSGTPDQLGNRRSTTTRLTFQKPSAREPDFHGPHSPPGRSWGHPRQLPRADLRPPALRFIFSCTRDFQLSEDRPGSSTTARQLAWERGCLWVCSGPPRSGFADRIQLAPDLHFYRPWEAGHRAPRPQPSQLCGVQPARVLPACPSCPSGASGHGLLPGGLSEEAVAEMSPLCFGEHSSEPQGRAHTSNLYSVIG